MRTGTLLRFLLPALLIASSCSVDATVSGDANVPAVGSDHNSFAFSVLARSLDLDRSYALSFDADSVMVGLAVAGYAAGSGDFRLLDASNQAVFSRDLAGNIAEGTAAATTRPVSARVRLAGYTGTVAIGVHAR